jgi:hypothetical protein
MRYRNRLKTRRYLKRKFPSDSQITYSDIVRRDEGKIIAVDSEEHSVEDLAVLQSHIIPCRLRKVFSDFAEIVTYIKILDEDVLNSSENGTDATLELTEEQFEELMGRTKIRKYILNIPLARLKYFKLSENDDESYSDNDKELIKVFEEDERLYEFRKKFIDFNKNFS